MRNYLFSISAHIVLILLLLYPFLNKSPESPEMENVVFLDFTELDKEEVKIDRTVIPVTPSPPPAKSAPAKKIKESNSKPAQSPPKSKVPDVKLRQEESVLSAPKLELESEDLDDLKKEAEEKALKQKEAEEKALKQKVKDEKVARFASLLNQSKISRSDSNTNLNSAEDTASDDPGIGTENPSNIQGVLGARKVLNIPTIKDDSQKQGRVVVKICVGMDGKVISSVYTQIGSTTNDTYLINLAEKGASEYLFSTSDNPRECGKVVIEFELK